MKRSRVFVEYVTIYRTIVHEKDAYEQIELTADVLKKFFIENIKNMKTKTPEFSRLHAHQMYEACTIYFCIPRMYDDST